MLIAEKTLVLSRRILSRGSLKHGCTKRDTAASSYGTINESPPNLASQFLARRGIASSSQTFSPGHNSQTVSRRSTRLARSLIGLTNEDIIVKAATSSRVARGEARRSVGRLPSDTERLRTCGKASAICARLARASRTPAIEISDGGVSGRK